MIVPLRPADAQRLWLVPESHYTTRLLRQHLEANPHLGWKEQASGDYVVGEYWKARPAIGLIMESSPSAQRAALVRCLLQSYQEAGSELVLLAEREVIRALRLYLDEGFAAIEEVVCYEKPDMSVASPPRRLQARALSDSNLPELVALEEESFPWLWWESETSFRQISGRADTSTLLAYQGNALVGYLILTARDSWGHINRICVRPRCQGQGFGRELMAVALETLARHGARSVGLNTQRSNTRSQQLYERCGFVPTGETFRIYGKWLR